MRLILRVFIRFYFAHDNKQAVMYPHARVRKLLHQVTTLSTASSMCVPLVSMAPLRGFQPPPARVHALCLVTTVQVSIFFAFEMCGWR